jgi:hypothetical protein
MDEKGGGLTTRANKFYRSTDGGNTWVLTFTGATFDGPGRRTCPNSYFACMFNDNGGTWRHMGWGQQAVQNGAVHYVYDGRNTSNGDPANVFYIRSTDSGSTFTAPVQLNTDTNTKGQWQPNLSIADDGSLLAMWYDESPTGSCVNGSTSALCYQMFTRKSTDGGVTWLPEEPLSDVVTPLPAQPDPGIIAEYRGDYDYSNTLVNQHMRAWVDGRVPVSSQSQQDVFFDQEAGGGGGGGDTVTITKAIWSTSLLQLTVTATDSDPTATQTCSKTSNGHVFGTLRGDGNGNYKGKFSNVTKNPVNITVTSDKGGTDSADVTVKP